MFEELFAPGRKHTNDERKRLELTRVDLNDGDPGRGPIDLSSGKVVVRLPKHDTEQGEASTGESGAGASGPGEPGPGEASAGQGPAPRQGPASEAE
ncbi:DUF6191 domain-containing protein [Streptomyces sp. NPDC058252]|uniref:DUF6191 domain-containing protein n=1 Tax=Streptomyces sp. NPDC058252 TaxID=3346405 RepID=UPI0036EFA6B6